MVTDTAGPASAQPPAPLTPPPQRRLTRGNGSAAATGSLLPAWGHSEGGVLPMRHSILWKNTETAPLGWSVCARVSGQPLGREGQGLRRWEGEASVQPRGNSPKEGG